MMDMLWLSNNLFDNYFDFYLVLKEYIYENMSYSNNKQKFHLIVQWSFPD